ncbi:MAG: hypothetical protein LBQ06_02540 [Frankiaceae bacterium]|nr:hypothetical protein [Frankiaceae bacterium]
MASDLWRFVRRRVRWIVAAGTLLTVLLSGSKEHPPRGTYDVGGDWLVIHAYDDGGHLVFERQPFDPGAVSTGEPSPDSTPIAPTGGIS